MGHDRTVPQASSIPYDPDALDEWSAELCGRVLNGRYRIEKILGYGMTGGVFRGTHMGLSKAVAIKILHEELRCNPNIRARFEREALTACKLSHRNCVSITDVDEDAELSYFVMPLVEGIELTEMTEAPMAAEAAVSIARQLLEALDHAHGHGIVHRDVKPENVLIVRRENQPNLVKLLDFGIAKVALPADHQRLTAAGQVFGTPQYMSPEQARGLDVSERSDLYSTGLILYELLSGAPPFTSEEPVALVMMQISKPIPSLRGTVSDELATVVEHLVAKEASDRYASAAEALDALHAVPEYKHSPSMAPSADVVASIRAPPVPARPSEPDIPLVTAPMSASISVEIPLTPAVERMPRSLSPPSRSRAQKVGISIAAVMVIAFWATAALFLYHALG